MKNIIGLTTLITISLLLLFLSSCAEKEDNSKLEYVVNRLSDSLKIDANWNKPQWEEAPLLEIKNLMGDKPKHTPITKVKMLYNDDFIYLIFNVHEKYVKSVATKINGRIYRDSAVEFFFTPSKNINDGYFNLEINCGGFPYFSHQVKFRQDVIDIEKEDIKKIKIAHTLPDSINTEIEELTEWTLECKIPISILGKYSKLKKPAHGVIWRANFYKTADATSNPHYITWNKVENEEPNFHLPKYFGNIKFN